jgi:hypothetical protein
VPKFYLEYFIEAGTDGKRVLWVYDKKSNQPRPQTPVNTCVEFGFYSFQTPDGAKSVEMEAALSQVESGAKAILDRLLGNPNGLLTADDIVALSLFLALMHVRVPRSMQSVSEVIAAGAMQFAKGSAADTEEIARYYRETKDQDHKYTEQEFAKLLPEVDERVTVKVDPKYALFQGFTIFPKVAEILLQMNWCLCQAPANRHFVTSDSPVCVFSRPLPGYAAFGSGLIRPDTEITFPISPKLVLLISWRYKQTKAYVSSGAFVREMNRRMAWSAQRYVISPFCSRSTTELVREASATTRQPKMDPKRLKQHMEVSWEKFRRSTP